MATESWPRWPLDPLRQIVDDPRGAFARLFRSDVLNRRDFQKLAAAAFGGLMTGSMQGCHSSSSDADAPFGQRHVCRGLNSCKNLGRSAKNDCAGRGTCATIQHECMGKNQCKNQGGCGTTPAMNSCAGKGECAMPLMAGAWKKVRSQFEAEMTRRGVAFGSAPAAPST